MERLEEINSNTSDDFVERLAAHAVTRNEATVSAQENRSLHKRKTVVLAMLNWKKIP
jgi:hypothetical protein